MKYKNLIITLILLLLVYFSITTLNINQNIVSKAITEISQSDLNLVESTIIQELNSKDRDFDLELFSIERIYQLNKEIYLKNDLEKKEFYAIADSFKKTNDFINSLQLDDFEKNVLKTSFILKVLPEFNQDYILSEDNSSYFPDPIQKYSYDNFVNDVVYDLKNNLESNKILKEYLSRESKNQDGINYINEFLFTNSKTNLQLFNYYKKIVEIQLLNELKYEKEIIPRYTNDKPNPKKIIDAYRALLLLEDTEASNSNYGFQIKTETSSLSNKKLNLIISLALEYVKVDKSSDAFALLDELNSNVDLYIKNLPEDLKSDTEVQYSLKYIKKQISQYRSALSTTEFSKMQIDLFAEDNKLDSLIKQREGYSDRFENEGYLNWPIISLASGGFGKDILNLIGVFDDSKKEILNIKSENQIYTKGLYSLGVLTGFGISSDYIKNWLDDKLTFDEKVNLVNRLLVLSYRANQLETLNPKLQDREFVYDKNINEKAQALVFDKAYEFNTEEQKKVYDFLEKFKGDAKQTYYSTKYNKYVKKLINEETVEWNPGKYQSLSNIDFQYFLKKVELEGKIKELKFEGTEKILDYIDESISPIYLIFTIGTSGSGTIFGSTSSLSSGIVFNFAENVIIDATAASILYSLDIDPYDNLVSNFGATFGTNMVLQAAFSRTIITSIKNGHQFEEVINNIDTDKLSTLGLEKKKYVLAEDFNRHFSSREREIAKKDYYTFLEVSKTATEQEIKDSYRKLVLKYHPDRNPTNLEQSTKMTQKLNEAYEIIGDSKNKQMYDKLKERYNQVGLRYSQTRLVDQTGDIVITNNRELELYLRRFTKDSEPYNRFEETFKIYEEDLVDFIDEDGTILQGWVYDISDPPNVRVRIKDRAGYIRGPYKMDLIKRWNINKMKGTTTQSSESFAQKVKSFIDDFLKGKTDKFTSKEKIEFNKNIQDEIKVLKNTNFLSDETNQIIKSYNGVGTISEYLAYKHGYYKHSPSQKGKDQIWLYWDGKEIENGHYLSDGSFAKYKLHVISNEENYDLILFYMTQKLRDMKITHKISPGINVAKPFEDQRQYGKLITIYTDDVNEFNELISEAKRIHNTYDINGIDYNEFVSNQANLQYEISVPETGNILYYTIENFNGEYLGDKKYNLRFDYLKKYWSQGPLDHIWKAPPKELLEHFYPNEEIIVPVLKTKELEQELERDFLKNFGEVNFNDKTFIKFKGKVSKVKLDYITVSLENGGYVNVPKKWLAELNPIK